MASAGRPLRSLERLERDVDAAVVRDVRAEKIEYPLIWTVWATPSVSQAGVGHLLHHRVGPLERRARRQFQVDDEVALVLLRDEPAGHRAEPEVREHQQPAVHDEHDDRQADEPADGPAVELRAALERPVEPAEEPPAEQVVQRLVEPVLAGVVARAAAAGTAPG